jgi:hypothetical protein
MSRRKQIMAVGLACVGILAVSRPAATHEPGPSYPAPAAAGVDNYVDMARHYALILSRTGSLNKATQQMQREIWTIEMLERVGQIAGTTPEGKEPRLHEALKRLQPALMDLVIAYKLQQAEDLLREVAEGVPDSESGKTAKKLLEELGKSP